MAETKKTTQDWPARAEHELGASASNVISILGWITGSCMNPIISKAHSGSLEGADFLQDDGLSIDEGHRRFEAEWSAEVANTSSARTSDKSPSLLRAIWRAFRADVLLAAGLKLAWGTLVLLSVSYFVRALLAYIAAAYVDKDLTSSEVAVGYVLCAFFFTATVLLSVALQQMNAVSARLGLRLKSAVATAVYRKSLRIDRHNPEGKMDVVSLVATDCNKLGDACTTLQFLWSGIVEATAILCVLLGLVGKAALPGMGILLLLVPFQYAVGMAAARFRKKTAEAADKRVALMDEILRAIKLVKMYAWEDKFAASVAHLRDKETYLARIGGYLKSLNLALVFVLPPLIALGIFGVHTIDSRLDGTLAFTLPKALRSMAECVTAAQRVQRYLMAPDREPERPQAHEPGVTFKSASFTYGPSSAPLLKDVTVTIPRGSLAMIAGPVGTGKSNMLAAIMGQMRLVSGTASVGGTFAYVPQTPWCAHGTVRDNILFGRPWNEIRYRRVLFACALERDLELMDDGDLTEIGERGMNLSGGQKQRIALARAAYSGADVLLLDAPLSAVDMYTCQHIFRYCITGLLSAEGTTVILVTHQVELFPKADNLIVMSEGIVAYSGPPQPQVIQQYFPNASATTKLTELDKQLLDAVQEGGPGTASGGAGGPGHEEALSPVPELTRSTETSVRRSTSGRSGLHGHHSYDSEAPSRQVSGRSIGSAGYHGRGHSGLAGQDDQGVANSMARTASVDALSATTDVTHRAMSLRADLIKAAQSSLEDGEAAQPAGSPQPSPGQDHGPGQGSPRVRSSPLPGQEAFKRALCMHQLRAAAGMSQPSASPTKDGAKYGFGPKDTVGTGSVHLPMTNIALVLPGSPEMAARTNKAAAAARSATASRDASEASSSFGARVNGYLAFFWELRWYLIVPCVAIAVITQVTRIFSDIWISLWVGRTYDGRDDEWYTGVYGGYVLVFFALLLCRGLSFYTVGLAAATRLHNSMFAAILRAPMSFFTLTPLGKVLSVFSRDQDSIDEALLDNMHMVIIYLMILGTTIGVVIRVLPIFAAIAAGLLIASVLVFRAYLGASRVLKERAGTTAGTVVAHVSETLQGIAVIQAYRAETRFASDNMAKLHAAQTAGFTLELLQLWLTFRQDLIGCILVLATVLLGVALDQKLPPAAAGLAVSNSFQILLFLSLMVRGAADVHAHMASVERVVSLSRQPHEPDLHPGPVGAPATGLDGQAYAARLKDGWPARGEVDFHGVVMSYLAAAPHVLKGVSFNVRPGEKVGVVGRTGAGKSSLIMSLFRLAPLAEGAIRIDGVDVSKLRLSDLRKRIAIIPQEPVMFEGTLRSNLDPFHEHSDEELTAALEKCLLKDVLSRQPAGLNQPVAHMGDNFSLGQRQLMCLARALLNGSKLLLLDEATAALDTDTDAAVQHVLRTVFADRTVMTIAHRLDTIIDSDRIIVMDAGRVAEFASPAELLRDEGSIFSQLCRQTGVGSFAVLKAAAERHASTLVALAAEVQHAEEARLGVPGLERAAGEHGPDSRRPGGSLGEASDEGDSADLDASPSNGASRTGRPSEDDDEPSSVASHAAEAQAVIIRM